MLFGRKKTHRNQIHYFTTLKGVVGMLRDPESTESVFDIEDGLRGLEATKFALEHVRRMPGVAPMIAARYLAPLPDVEAFQRYPEGSLAHAFAKHIVDHGFDPDYYRKLDVVDDIDWVMMRMRQTHDIWHVVTGIGTDPIGELALKAFELAQTRRPLAAVITTGGVLRYLVKDPDELGEVLRAISAGYRLGLAAAPFLAQRWEEHWERPVVTWRAMLGVDLDAHDPARIDGRARHSSTSSGASGAGAGEP